MKKQYYSAVVTLILITLPLAFISCSSGGGDDKPEPTPSPTSAPVPVPTAIPVRTPASTPTPVTNATVTYKVDFVQGNIHIEYIANGMWLSVNTDRQWEYSFSAENGTELGLAVDALGAATAVTEISISAIGRVAQDTTLPSYLHGYLRIDQNGNVWFEQQI